MAGRLIVLGRHSHALDLIGSRTIRHSWARRYRYASTLSSTVTNPNHEWTLYQYAICPYCNIAKAILNYTNVPFSIQEVNPLTKKELKNLPDTTYRKVPILLWKSGAGTNPEEVAQINGSESIVDHVLSTTAITTTTSSNSIDTTSASSQKWTKFARDELAPLLYPNLCNTLANSYAAFGYVHNPHSPFSLTQRYAIQLLGSVAMYMAASKVKKKRNIVDERAALFGALQEFNDALQGDFLNPTATDPHLGDLTVYGVLRGLRGLPIMNEIRDSFATIDAWYLRMEARVEKS